MKFLDLTHRKDGYIELRPANPDYPVFKVNDPENFQIWGTVILNTNAFREDLAQYWNFQEKRLLTPSSSTITITQAASDILKSIYRQGYQYKKAGVIVMNIGPDSPIQQDLFDINAEQFQKMKRLDEVIDRINRMHGSETIVLGSQQYTRKDGKGKADVFANAIKHDFRSPSPTTRWSDVIRLNAKDEKKKE
jgi:DNA polymerase V